MCYSASNKNPLQLILLQGLKIQKLPKPDNIKNFYASFFFLPKSLLGKRIQKPTKATRPNRPHPLLLAYEFQQLFDDNVVHTKAGVARRYGISRARVTQIMNLLKLPSEIKHEIIQLSEERQQFFTERKLRKILNIVSVQGQMAASSTIRANLSEEGKVPGQRRVTSKLE